MKIHEYQAKELLSAYGIPIEKHRLCYTADEAVAAYRLMEIPQVVIKAQVLTGGRGKAGGIKLARHEEEVYSHTQSILTKSIHGLPVTKVLVSQAVSISSEYYLSSVVDRNKQAVVLIISSAGGIDIEEVARDTPEKINQFTIDPFIGIPDYLARRIAFLCFADMRFVQPMSRIIQSLYQLFIENDASLAEINPLVLTTEGNLIAVDAKIVFDTNALYRHPNLQTLFDPTPDEKIEALAKEKGFSYIRMDGEIGCMVNGAGLAMATMDMIKRYGAQPANFLDIGGSSNPVKVVEAMKLLLQDKQVKVVLINIFGGITRCDDVALGLLEAFEQIHTTIPTIVRLTGTNEKKGRELLRASNYFRVTQSMNEATLWAVQSLNQVSL